MSDKKVMNIDGTKHIPEFLSKHENGEISDEEMLSIACSALVVISFLGYSTFRIAEMSEESAKKIAEHLLNHDKHGGQLIETITTKSYAN